MDNALNAHGRPDSGTPDVPDRLIAGRNLCKRYETTGACIEVLKNADFDIHTGETLSIVGPSGIGKSTLLHILGALDRPDSGRVLFKNEDIFTYDGARLARFRNESIGFVFQFHHLLPEFTARENAMMPALIRGLPRPGAEEAAEAMLERVGLADRMAHRVTELSGGEQQRVALARALVLKPDILLADEPTGNLDKKNSDHVHELLMELNREFGMTLVVVTHSMELASFMSRKVTILDGQLMETDRG